MREDFWPSRIFLAKASLAQRPVETGRTGSLQIWRDVMQKPRSTTSEVFTTSASIHLGRRSRQKNFWKVRPVILLRSTIDAQTARSGGRTRVIDGCVYTPRSAEPRKKFGRSTRHIDALQGVYPSRTPGRPDLPLAKTANSDFWQR